MPHAGNFLNPFGTTVNTPLKTEVGRQVCFTSQILPPRNKATPPKCCFLAQVHGKEELELHQGSTGSCGSGDRSTSTLACYSEVLPRSAMPKAPPGRMASFFHRLYQTVSLVYGNS